MYNLRLCFCWTLNSSQGPDGVWLGTDPCTTVVISVTFLYVCVGESPWPVHRSEFRMIDFHVVVFFRRSNCVCKHSRAEVWEYFIDTWSTWTSIMCLFGGGIKSIGASSFLPCRIKCGEYPVHSWIALRYAHTMCDKTSDQFFWLSSMCYGV